MKEQVKEILRRYFSDVPGEDIGNGIAEEICQLFEPKPDEFTSEDLVTIRTILRNLVDDVRKKDYEGDYFSEVEIVEEVVGMLLKYYIPDVSHEEWAKQNGYVKLSQPDESRLLTDEKLRGEIAFKCREVLHTYSMVGLLRGKSPVSWDEAYLLEWSDVLADQILALTASIKDAKYVTRIAHLGSVHSEITKKLLAEKDEEIREIFKEIEGNIFEIEIDKYSGNFIWLKDSARNIYTKWQALKASKGGE